MSILQGVKPQKELIIEWKGYVIRKIKKPYWLAIPKDAIGFAHRIQRGEGDDISINQLKHLIDINENIKKK